MIQNSESRIQSETRTGERLTDSDSAFAAKIAIHHGDPEITVTAGSCTDAVDAQKHRSGHPTHAERWRGAR
jgi:hypothetical protein